MCLRPRWSCGPALLFLCAVIFPAILHSAEVPGQLSVPLTVQEAIYPGAPTSGISRAQDPLTVGIPMADSAAIKDTSHLGLNGASVGQFRVLGRWPSGNIQWVLVDTQVDLKGGSQNRDLVLNNAGRGNFGGADLATDRGPAIVVNTGAASFLIRKKRFNLFRQVEVNGTRLLGDENDAAGLVVLGPASPGTTCDQTNCTTEYSSGNDQDSTCSIDEDNGPVRAVVRCEGSHKDAGNHRYMRYLVRMHFYKNKSYVKLQVTLRNADEGESNTFNSAAKGFASYELRLHPSLAAGTRKFTFGTDGGVASGVLEQGANQQAYLYQAYSDDLEDQYWNAPTCAYGRRSAGCVYSYITRTPTRPFKYSQDGYEVVEGQKVLAKGDHTKHPQGWAELTDSMGAGLEVGVYQMSAYWPKSLQFANGGAEVRVGIWPNQRLSTTNADAAIPYYQAWPQYSVHDLYLDFHAAALTSPANEFLKFQRSLVARAQPAYYNSTHAFLYPLLDHKEEDGYWNGMAGRNGFTWHGGPGVPDRSPHIYRFYPWGVGGGSNQSEMRWGWVEQWLTRGLPGRFLQAAHFYRFQVEQAFPRSDFNSSGDARFSWRTHSPASDLDYLGLPAEVVSQNRAFVNRQWIDQEHAHWYGMGDFYFLTGDESIKDQMLDGVADRFLNTKSYFNQGVLWNTRATGAALMGLARYHRFLSAIGKGADTSATDAIIDLTLKRSVFPELCVSGFPAGCDPAPIPYRGVSRTRGVAGAGHDVGDDNNCAVGGGKMIRCAKPWMLGILLQGMWEAASVRTPAWPNNQTGASDPYQLTLDLGYGIGNWTSHEDFVLGRDYRDSGLKYDLALDYPNPMANPTASTDYLEQYEFNYFMLAKYSGQLTSAQQKQFELTYAHNAAGNNFNVATLDDQDMYLTSALIDLIVHPPNFALVDVPVQVKNNGLGSYILSWTTPPGATAYRVKRSSKKIVDWIGFDPKANQFTGDPAKTENWFAAAEIRNNHQSTCPPQVAAPGAMQSCEVNGLDPGTSWQFAVKAYTSQATK